MAASGEGGQTPAQVEMSPASAGRKHTQHTFTYIHEPRCGESDETGQGSVGHWKLASKGLLQAPVCPAELGTYEGTRRMWVGRGAEKNMP